MSRRTVVLGAVGLLALAASLATLTPACGEQQTCQSVMDHFYDASCALTRSGTPLTRSEAVTWCEELKPAASDCGCSSQLQAVLDCLESSGSNECDGCGVQFDAFNACADAC